nr:c-type cytochrome [candidate division Zixibacteria bacterium]
MFFLDFFGNRILIAVIAIVHVFINHPLAVGAYPLITLLEWWGVRKGNMEWDRVAYKVTFVLFVVTTTAGALTGVGIWFSTALIAPFGIGSLLRVFFWAWFSEWLVFISEVVLIMVYFLTWKRWGQGIWKKVHIGFGAALSAFSWLTMLIIVAILGFMMGSGSWPVERTLWSGIANPLYLPQLLFRTAYAMGLAGLCIWFLLFFFTRKGSELRQRMVRFVGIWMLAWVAPLVVGSWWYWKVVPDSMKDNIDVGLLTQRFMQWHETLAIIMIVTIIALMLAALLGVIKPRYITGLVLVIPFILGLWLLGHFERVREFIRKPYVIEDYMYSNGVKVSDLPVFQRDGILPYATFVQNHQVTSSNKIAAGRDVFLVACSRCHTTRGINSMMTKFNNLYGPGEWDETAMTAFIQTMHNSRTYMPPFPGNDKELEALVAYLKDFRKDPRFIVGAHADWTVPPGDATP